MSKPTIRKPNGGPKGKKKRAGKRSPRPGKTTPPAVRPAAGSAFRYVPGEPDGREVGASQPEGSRAGPPVGLAEQMEREAVVFALQKKKAGQVLSHREITLIRRFEEQREDQWVMQALSRVRQIHFCELLGVSRKVLLEWEQQGCPYSQEGRAKYYDLRAVLPWLKRRWLGGEGVDGKGITKQSAEIKLLIRREAALQLKMQIMNGELISRSEKQRLDCTKVIAVRAGLEALQRALAPAVLELGENATIEDAEHLIWEYVEPLLLKFAEGTRAFYSIDN